MGLANYQITLMKIEQVKKFKKDATPVFILSDKEKISNHPLFKELGKEDQKQISLIESQISHEGEFSHTIHTKNGPILIIGAGKELNNHKLIMLSRRVIYSAKKAKMENIIINFSDFLSNLRTYDVLRLTETITTQFEIANFEFLKYKTSEEKQIFVKKIFILYNGKANLKQAIETGKIIGEEINKARNLSNTPGGEMTPTKLAASALKESKNKLKVSILNEKNIEKLKMGGILGVSKGSLEKPRFIIMEYKNGGKTKPVVLVGKGVTFDTGGLNLKPTEAMNEMHMDMSGGASVIHILSAARRLGIKKNIIGLIPTVENMPSGSSYHPGDILKTMSGKTIEVLNTDAEGRIILADALHYAKKYNPRLIVDIATLTGAAMVALGPRISAIFSKEENIVKKMEEIGEERGDFVWRMPLWTEYEEDIKGTFGDITNTGKIKVGGAIHGAVFLWQFIKDYPWVHIDIAPRMVSTEGEFLSKGSVGASINLLVNFLRSF